MNSAQTLPSFPGAATLSDADLWEHYYALGLSPELAQQHVLRRRSARQAVADNPLPPPQVTSPEGAALLGATRTATSGFADELVGALQALRGPPAQNGMERWFGALGGKDVSGPLFDTGRYTQGRDQIREIQSQAVAEHPKMSLAAGLVGARANPLNYLLGPLTRFMGPASQGATYGGTLGAAQGAGEGTSGPSRAVGALQDAVAGAAVGGLVGGASGIAGKLWAKVFGKAPPPKVSEATVRAQLAKLKFTPEQTEQAVAIWRQGGILPGGPTTMPAPPPPPTVRPGETIRPTENLDKATFLRRGGTVRQDTSPISGNRSMSFTPGKGQTLPWYPRGGQAEQTVMPLPASAPTGTPPNQVAILLDYLKSAQNPQDALARMGTFQDLGMAVSPQDQNQLLALLFGSR